MATMGESQFHVVVTGPDLAEEAEALLSKTCGITYTKAYVEPARLSEKIHEKQADAILVRTGRITAEVIQASAKLKVISKHGIGVDNIDIVAATKSNIPVLIAAHSNYESVAEHVLGLLF